MYTMKTNTNIRAFFPADAYAFEAFSSGGKIRQYAYTEFQIFERTGDTVTAELLTASQEAELRRMHWNDYTGPARIYADAAWNFPAPADA